MKKTLTLMVLAVVASGLAAAQEDPPYRVARLNLANGSVSFQPGGMEEWVPAVVNRPLTSGDRLWVDENSRAEVHIGSTAYRLGALTNFDLLNLNDESTQIRLSQGLLMVHLRYLGDRDSVEIDTPQASISLLRTGLYRIEVKQDGQSSVITVRGGEAEATGGGSAFTIHPNETGRIDGVDDMRYIVSNALGYDGFDDWSADRDRREDRAGESSRYVSREMIGYEDLDANGSWQDEPEYGHVWIPRVSAGWAPYRNGHWAWIEPWGWTWVDDAPWGFAPFHYGRWAYIRSGWGWIPGAIAVRPVYAPALVAFVGGSHFNLSIGIGGGGAGVAWFPLGPREVYVPAYRVSNTYVRNVNITHVTNITNITNVTNMNTNITNVRYVNQTVPGGVTAVSQTAFISSRNVAQSAVPVTRQQISAGQVMGTAPQIAPRGSSVLGANANRAAQAAQPPASVMNRQVVAKTAPPAAPMAFTQREHMLAANPGRPLDAQQLRSAPSQQPQVLVRPAMPVRVQAVQPQGQVAQQPGQLRQQPQVQANPPQGQFGQQPGGGRPGMMPQPQVNSSGSYNGTRPVMPAQEGARPVMQRFPNDSGQRPALNQPPQVSQPSYTARPSVPQTPANNGAASSGSAVSPIQTQKPIRTMTLSPEMEQRRPVQSLEAPRPPRPLPAEVRQEQRPAPVQREERPQAVQREVRQERQVQREERQQQKEEHPKPEKKSEEQKR